MAIGLDDIRQKRKSNKVKEDRDKAHANSWQGAPPGFLAPGGPQGLELQEKLNGLRPWQEQSEQQGTRTLTAKEAVRRAREIVQKNNLMIQELRNLNGIPQEVEVVSESSSQEEETENSQGEKYRIKTRRSFRGFFHEVFGSRQ